ncbi:MAG: HYR domain-containing protein, partial [Acidobacteriota bacterium]
MNISLPGPSVGCSLEVTVDMVLEDPGNCPEPMLVNLMTLQGLPLATSPFLNASHINQSFMYQVIETTSGNSCWGTIKVEDKLGPTITNCGDFTMPCIANHKPISEGGNAPMPTFTDCSQIVNISYSDIISDIACPPPGSNLAGTASAVITRKWTATDKWGYSSTCTQYITLVRLSLQNYTPVCPVNVNMQCGNGNPNTHPDATGYPTVLYGNVNWQIKPGGEGFCEMAVSYHDEVFNICGGGKKILRTWTIYDWCLPVQPGLNPWACIQVIKIEDTVPPVVVCPAPIVQGSASNGCVASLTLPPANVTDACSQFTVKVLTPFGVVNGNGGLLLNVPVGVHQITYAATDACGNLGTCTTTLTVKDDSPPVAVCDEHTTVALTADGTAIVSAVTFDDGSLDNCGIDYFKARRMASSCAPEGVFEDYISFSCCDVGETIMVAMRVYDKSGNYNECMVEVNVQDKIDPTITCPPDKTVECTEPIPPVTAPVVWDNCPGVTWTVTETDNINNCGVGVITRVFTATDHVGRKASCTQKIYVINSYPFNLSNIIWPLDYYTSQCDPDTDPTDLPAGYDKPTISEDQCDLIAVTHTDQLLPTNPPACFKILRKWIVINWCVYNPNQPNSPGYWEHVQIIKVQDETDPVLTCPGNVVAPSSDANCAFGYVAVDAATATDCSPNIKWTTKIDYHSNNSIDVVGTNPNVSGSYPFGLHTVTITAEDYCGNSSTCSFTIEVVDGKKPTPVCINGLAAELMADPAGNGGMVTLTPQMFNAGSFDNCTSKPNLQLQISPSVFTCTEVGINVVTLWVTDEEGNADYCETWVDIQDNMVNCPGSLSANVAGNVADPVGQGVQGVLMDVSGNGPLTAPVTTLASGNYQFVGMEQGYDYTLTPAYNMNPLNGVTTYDLVLITRHILNVELLGSPYKMIAADVNKS